MSKSKNIKLSLAPMAGITDLPFRLICKELGADIVYSEMISATGLFYKKNRKSITLAQSIQKEALFAVQLFGNNPEHFAKAAQIISNLNKLDKKSEETYQINNFRKPEEININFGCPAKKICKQESGCSLMKKPNLAKKIILSVLDNTDLPVSIKIRSGIKGTEAIEFLTKIQDLNWSKVIVHGRTYEEGFSGKIDFDKIKKIKRLFPSKIVAANGGIFSPEDAKEVLEKTGADELAIARGCLGNPWLFSQTKAYLKNGSYQKPSLEQIKNIALKHALLFEKYNPNQNLTAFRKHLGWYFKDFENSKQLRKELFLIEKISDIERILKVT